MQDHTTNAPQSQPYFPENITQYAPWVAEYGLCAPYGECQCGCGEKTSIAARNRYERGQAKGEPIRFIEWHGIGKEPDPIPVYEEGEYAPWVEQHGLQYPYGKCQCGCGGDAPIAKRNQHQRGYVKGQPIQFIHAHHTCLRRTPPIEEHFWSRVQILGPNDCWLWQASRNRKGYGQVSVNSESVPAHRVAWELTYGPIPDGLWVLHKCDNPPCTNPSHLFLGTNADNVADKVAKNRQPVGTKTHNAKLTEQQVIEARQRFAEGGITITALAEECGVNRITMKNVLQCNTWRHIP